MDNLALNLKWRISLPQDTNDQNIFNVWKCQTLSYEWKTSNKTVLDILRILLSPTNTLVFSTS